MKIIAYTKLILKSTWKNMSVLLFSFVVFPVVLSLIVGYAQRNMMNPNLEINKLKVYLSDKDNTKSSQALLQFLNDEQVKKLLDIKANLKDANYSVIIPLGYEKAILNNQQAKININVSSSGNDNSVSIISQILEDYDKSLSHQLIILSKVDQKSLSEEDKKQLISKLQAQINENNSKGLIDNILVKGKKSLSSYEYYSTSFLAFLFVMVASNLVAAGFMDKENGMEKRIMSAPLTKYEYFNYNMVMNFIFSFILYVIYILVFRLMKLSFNCSIPLLLFTALIQTLLTVGLASILWSFTSKKFSMTFMSVLTIIQMLLGGMFIPPEKINIAAIKVISNFSPGALITRSYNNLLIYNNLDSIALYLGAMVILSLVMYIIGLLGVKVRWGRG